MVRVVVQHRQRLLREGVSQLLAEVGDIEIVGAVALADRLLEMCRTSNPDVVVLQFTCVVDGAMDLAGRVARFHPEVRLVGLHDRQPTACELQDACAAGIQLLSHGDGIVPVVTAVLGGPDLPRRRAPRSQVVAPGHLTAREASVLSLVGGGWTSQEISDELDISPKTVENHKQRIFAKLGVQNKAHAVSVAIRRGLIHSGRVMESAASG